MKFDISTIFWLFFIIAALQPLLRKRFLKAMRQRLFASFEKYQRMGLYPQPIKRQLSVEYLPSRGLKGVPHKS